MQEELMTMPRHGASGAPIRRCDSLQALQRRLAAAGWPVAGQEAKGDAGQVVVVGGSALYPGPPFLSALAALRIGVDDSRVIAPDHGVGARLVLDSHVHRGGGEELDAGKVPALLEHTVEEFLRRRSARTRGRIVVLIGPGMGGHPDPGPLLSALADVRTRRAADIRLVVDGHLGGGATGMDRMQAMRPDVVLLSGDEATGLLDQQPPDGLAEGARRLGTVLVAKGPVDHIHGPGRSEQRTPTDGAVELTKSGTGDVMAGAVTALLARGLAPFDAAAVGCWLMQTASRSTRSRHGPGFLPSELADQLSVALLAGKGTT
jgi:ADP-dependent NAD(P)H-hydrate dehydratase